MDQKGNAGLNIFSFHNRRGTSSIRMTPTKDEGKQFYVAEGKMGYCRVK
jgi:hypothetical protein